MTVIPDKHTFQIWQGSTFYEVLNLFQTLDSSQPRDLRTGFTAEMIIRDKPGGTPLITLNTSNGGIVLGSSSIGHGAIELKISSTGTAAIPWKSAVYDLTLTDTNAGVTDALLYGAIKVNGV